MIMLSHFVYIVYCYLGQNTVLIKKGYLTLINKLKCIPVIHIQNVYILQYSVTGIMTIEAWITSSWLRDDSRKLILYKIRTQIEVNMIMTSNLT